jgi:hypothetical protein
MTFSTAPIEKRGFQIAYIFDDLQPSKMPAHPCAGRSLLKNDVFRQLLTLLSYLLRLGSGGSKRV